MAAYIAILFILALSVGVYVYFRLKRLAEFYHIKSEKVIVKAAIIILTGILTLLSFNIFNFTAIILLHIIAASACMDIVAFAVAKTKSKCVTSTEGDNKGKSISIFKKIYECGIIPIMIGAIIIVYGYINMGSVIETDYSVDTDKSVQGYRIALITDVHFGTVQDKDILTKKCKEISHANPDIVILGGDIVEEGTSKKDMEEVFKQLGTIQNKYGIYYVYGNHDRQPYTDDRTFSNDELDGEIEKNNIKILKDSYVNIENDLIIGGRNDAAWGNTSPRASVKEVLKGADKNKYIIMVDHQPIEAKENNNQGVDLELSGHTHAGQIWPVGIVSQLTGMLNYGEYYVGKCEVIVSSGFAGWKYPIRTGKHSEYVIIDIK